MASKVLPAANFVRVNAAATGNLTLSGEQTVDGVALTAGMTCFAAAQSVTTQIAIYFVAAGAWTLADPGPSDGLIILPVGGSTYGNHLLQITNSVTWGVGTPTWSDITGGSSGGNVTLTGAQTISGVKTFASGADPVFAKEAAHSLIVAATTTTATAGGALSVAAGAGVTTGAGGALALAGGAGGNDAVGGAASLTGGAAGGGNRAGGATTIGGGAGAGSAAGGNVIALAGAGGATGAGGGIAITGGAGGATSGNGGGVALTGGAATNGGSNGGNIVIAAGAKNGGGVDGSITIGATNTASVLIGAAAISTTVEGRLNAANSVAVPANGSAAASVRIGTSGPGVFVGSGVPNVVAPKGSLYLRTDGTTTNDRAYIATDSAGAWTALTTAA